MSPTLSEKIILSGDDRDASLADRNTHATRIAGKGADPEKKALFASVTKRIDYTPKIGTELHGIKLSQLTEQQSEELAALISERGVVFFRDQEDLNHDEHVKLGKRWGPLHVHPLVPHNQENPEVIVLDSRFTPPSRYNTNNSWHSDVSFEPAPSSYSILKFDEIPEAGGDTHPVVRTNPVTGWKAIFTNSTFTREINGVSPAESKWILEYLNDLVAKRLDYQVRFHWEKHSVAIWDNRSTFHTGVPDFRPYHRRGLRVTVSGEKPFYDAESGTQAKAWEATANAIVAKQEAAVKLAANDADAIASARTA